MDKSFSPKDFACGKMKKKTISGRAGDGALQVMEGNFGGMAFYRAFITPEEEKQPFEVIHIFLEVSTCSRQSESRTSGARLRCQALRIGFMYRQLIVPVFEQTCRIIEAAFIIVEVRNLKQRPAKVSDHE